MTNSAELVAFFERSVERPSDDLADHYVAGLREADGGTIGVSVMLPAHLVETTVLAAARMAPALNADGSLRLDGEGLSDDVLEAVHNAIPADSRTLEALVADSLRLDLLDAEDDAVGSLKRLRGRLADALERVDATLVLLERNSRPRRRRS